MHVALLESKDRTRDALPPLQGGSCTSSAPTAAAVFWRMPAKNLRCCIRSAVIRWVPFPRVKLIVASGPSGFIASLGGQKRSSLRSHSLSRSAPKRGGAAGRLRASPSGAKAPGIHASKPPRSLRAPSVARVGAAPLFRFTLPGGEPARSSKSFSQPRVAESPRPSAAGPAAPSRPLPCTKPPHTPRPDCLPSSSLVQSQPAADPGPATSPPMGAPRCPRTPQDAPSRAPARPGRFGPGTPMGPTSESWDDSTWDPRVSRVLRSPLPATRPAPPQACRPAPASPAIDTDRLFCSDPGNCGRTSHEAIPEEGAAAARTRARGSTHWSRRRGLCLFVPSPPSLPSIDRGT